MIIWTQITSHAKSLFYLKNDMKSSFNLYTHRYTHTHTHNVLILLLKDINFQYIPPRIQKACTHTHTKKRRRGKGIQSVCLSFELQIACTHHHNLYTFAWMGQVKQGDLGGGTLTSIPLLPWEQSTWHFLQLE